MNDNNKPRLIKTVVQTFVDAAPSAADEALGDLIAQGYEIIDIATNIREMVIVRVVTLQHVSAKRAGWLVDEAEIEDGDEAVQDEGSEDSDGSRPAPTAEPVAVPIALLPAPKRMTARLADILEELPIARSIYERGVEATITDLNTQMVERVMVAREERMAREEARASAWDMPLGDGGGGLVDVITVK